MVDVAFLPFFATSSTVSFVQLQHTAALRVYDDAWLHFSGSALTVLYFIGGTLPDIRSGLIGIYHISLFHPHLIPYQYHFSNANGSARLENDTCQAILNLYHLPWFLRGSAALFCKKSVVISISIPWDPEEVLQQSAKVGQRRIWCRLQGAMPAHSWVARHQETRTLHIQWVGYDDQPADLGYAHVCPIFRGPLFKPSTNLCHMQLLKLFCAVAWKWWDTSSRAMGLVDLVKPRKLPLTDVVPRSDTASDLGGFTMDSPCCWGWWHGVCLGHSENQLVNWVLLRLATTRVRYRGLCRIGGDDSLAPSTCREILWCSADFWIDFGRFHPFAFPILQMLVRCFNLSIPSLRFLQEG